MFQKKRIIAAGLALTLALGTTACQGKEDGGAGGKSGANATDELAPEFSYVAKYASFPAEFGNGENIVFSDGNAYGAAMDYEKGVLRVAKSSVANGELSAAQTLFEKEQNGNVYHMDTDAEGNVYLIEMVYPKDPDEGMSEEEIAAFYENYDTQLFLQKFTPSGELVFESNLKENIEEAEYFYPQNFLVDGQGRSYVYNYENGIILFDEKGESAGNIEVNQMSSWISGFAKSKDGKIFAASVNYNQNGSECVLSEVDFDKKSLGKSYKNFPGANGTLQTCPGNEGQIFCSDGNGLYEYSLEKEEATKLLTWLDIDVAGNDVTGIMVTADGKPCAMVADYNEEKTEFVSLDKVKTEEIAKRTIITLGTIYDDSDVNSSVINFNKTNDQYRIKVKTYMDANDWSEKSYTDAITNLTNDILSKNGPDILDLSALDIDNLASKGVLADLMPLLEKSTKLNKEDFFEHILEASTMNGVLCYIPSSFTLETLAAKTSVVGNKMGWTFSDMINLHKQYPDAELMEYADRESILQMMLILDKSSYVNTEKGECYFDGQQFKDLLTFAKSFPEEYDYANQRLTPLKIKDNSLILVDAGIYSFDEVQSLYAYFDGEPVTFIGYPSGNGGNGCILSPRGLYGITDKCENKEAAFSFIESLLTKEDDGYTFGFSTLKSKYEEQKRKALDVKPILDENGEPMKDEKGNIVYDGMGGGYTMTDDFGEQWDYVYRPVTKEEVEIVEKLLTDAVVVNVSMDTELNKIITEEASAFFQGMKSVDDVANVIQNRVNLYLKENK